MPRKSRKKSATDIYHIIMRGINRQVIFEDSGEYSRFLHTLQKYKEQCGYEIFAYCLMPNHIHLLMRVGLEPLEQVMRRICGSYVYWYNAKHERIGNLFQDRFKSEAIENDSYFLTVLRYIHQNPIKAGLASRVEEYPWSSINEYCDKPTIIDVNFGLAYFHTDRYKAQIDLVQFCKEVNDDACLEIEQNTAISDRDAQETVSRVCQIDKPSDLMNLNRNERDQYLRLLKEEYHLSIRQIERLTGINRGVILKA